MKKNAKSYWSDLELEGLLEDEDSRVTFERVKKHTALHPAQLRNIKGALHEYLGNFLNYYDPSLKGLILSYNNPKLLGKMGYIVYDKPDIHLDVEADFYIFRPEVGHSLKGIVEKVGPNHLGILVHKAFKVSVPKPDDEEDWPGHKVRSGQEVRFTVVELDYKYTVPYIKGLLNEEDYLNGCQLFIGRLAEDSDSNVTPGKRKRTFSEKIDVISPTKMKFANTRTTFDSDSDVIDDAEDNRKEIKKLVKNVEIDNTLTEEEDAKSKKKSKKKSKHLKPDSDPEEFSFDKVKIEPESEIEDNVKITNLSKLKKEKKKEKHRIADDDSNLFKKPKAKTSPQVESDLDSQDQPKKTKKIKKSKTNEALQYESEAEDRKRAKELLKKELNLSSNKNLAGSHLSDSEIDESMQNNKVIKSDKNKLNNEQSNVDYLYESEVEDRKRAKAALRKQLNLSLVVSDSEAEQKPMKKKKLKSRKLLNSIGVEEIEEKDSISSKTKHKKSEQFSQRSIDDTECDLNNSQLQDHLLKQENLSQDDKDNKKHKLTLKRRLSEESCSEQSQPKKKTKKHETNNEHHNNIKEEDNRGQTEEKKHTD